MKVSITEIMNFVRCRRMWKYKSHNMMGLTPKEESNALVFGSAIHKALESYYNPDGCTSNWISIFSEYWNNNAKSSDDEEKLHNLGVGMLQHYAVWAPSKDDFDVINLETKYEIPFSTDIIFTLKTDGIVRRDDGIWILENKTYSVEPDVDFWSLDLQTTAYPWAITQLVRNEQITGIDPDEKICGVIYNGLKKKLPTVPEPLKKGGLSKAMSIDTTYDVYLRAILNHNLNPVDYTEILNALKLRGNPFFKRINIRRTTAEFRTFREFIYNVSEEMLRAQEITELCYPSPNRDCTFSCGYNKLCISENVAGDTDDLIKNLYNVYKEKTITQRMF